MQKIKTTRLTFWYGHRNILDICYHAMTNTGWYLEKNVKTTTFIMYKSRAIHKKYCIIKDNKDNNEYIKCDSQSA